jgi:signal peptidase I
MIAIVLFAVFGIIQPYVIGTIIVTSGSMTPTLQVGDQVFINKFIYRFRAPHYGEVITFHAPRQVADGQGEDYVKRVIGLPHDTIEVRPIGIDRNGQPFSAVFRNGQQLNEPYIAEPMTYGMPLYKVPANKLFVMGDNRNESYDSHTWGALDLDQVVGMITLRLRPMNRFGYVR